MSAQFRSKRHILYALTASIVLHLLGLWWATYLEPSAPSFFAVARLPLPKQEHFTSPPQQRHMAPSMERLGSIDTPAPLAIGNADTLPLPDTITTSKFPQNGSQLTTSEKHPIQFIDSSIYNVRLDSIDWHQDFRPVDPMAIDTEGRRRMAALFDPQYKRLQRLYIHLPSYRNSPPNWRSARELTDGLDSSLKVLEGPEWRRIFPQPQIHFYPLGEIAQTWIPTDKEPMPDPLHGFPLYYNRRRLALVEMWDQYPIVDLRYIDVQSTEVMLDYLEGGGFALAPFAPFSHIVQQLTQRLGERVQRVLIDYHHPIAHIRYELKIPFSFEGVQIDNRLVAVQRTMSTGSALYINVLAYALLQNYQGGRMLPTLSSEILDEIPP